MKQCVASFRQAKKENASDGVGGKEGGGGGGGSRIYSAYAMRAAGKIRSLQHYRPYLCNPEAVVAGQIVFSKACLAHLFNSCNVPQGCCIELRLVLRFGSFAGNDMPWAKECGTPPLRFQTSLMAGSLVEAQ